MGLGYLTKSHGSIDSGDKSLKEQLYDISFDTSKRIKLFSLLIRLFISILLLIILAIDVHIGLYPIESSVSPLSILFIYTLLVIYMLNLCKKSESFKSLNGVMDIVYVTCEILAVYFAILTFPTHPANMYSNSLKGFWSVLIVLSVFTGKWYYGFYSGGLVAVLNASTAYFYSKIKRDFEIVGIDFQKVDPLFQIFVWSLYYFLQGALISFPFYLFRKQQSMALNAKTENIVARPYYDLCLEDGQHLVGDYLINKVSSSNDVIGADFTSMKPTIADHCYGALIIGDVIGHGLNRSPGAIIAMAAFKSCYTTDPVYVQETINRVLVDVDKSSGGKAICLSIRLMENGIIEYSGKIDSFTLVEKENVRSISLSSKGEILGIQPLLLVTEKSVISMNVGDSLYLKTDGIHDLQDDKTVVIITRLSDEERLAISESSKD